MSILQCWFTPNSFNDAFYLAENTFNGALCAVVALLLIGLSCVLWGSWLRGLTPPRVHYDGDDGRRTVILYSASTKEFGRINLYFGVFWLVRTCNSGQQRTASLPTLRRTPKVTPHSRYLTHKQYIRGSFTILHWWQTQATVRPESLQMK